VIENPRGDEYRRMYMFATSPIYMPFPFSYRVKTVVGMEGNVISSCLGDRKLDFMWRIGNALTDPVKNPCVIISYGRREEHPGHEREQSPGYQRQGDCPDRQKFQVAGRRGGDELAEKRVVVCDECGIEEDMNYNNIKRWTSNAPVQSKGASA
jgi:hypothetical protein